jgi:magnesium transporter
LQRPRNPGLEQNTSAVDQGSGRGGKSAQIRDIIAPMLTSYPAQKTSGAGAKPVWIDLLDPTPEERDHITKHYGLRIPAREALQEIESSSRLRADGQVLTLSMPLIVPEERPEAVPAPLGFILSPSVLVSVRFTEVRGFAEARARLERGDVPSDSATAFAVLIESIVDFRADLLESISARVGAISKRAFGRHIPQARRTVLDGALREMLAAIGAAGESLSEIRESLLGLQRLVSFSSERAHEWLRPEIRARLATALVDLTSLSDYEAHLWAKIQFLLDAILGFINTDQNDIFKVLTIVSVVGIPPTLIASIYGMNFHNMPELGWRYGYQFGLALIVASTILPILWFKWRGWW